MYYVGFPMDMDKVWVLIKYTLLGLETWQSHNIGYIELNGSMDTKNAEKEHKAGQKKFIEDIR